MNLSERGLFVNASAVLEPFTGLEGSASPATIDVKVKRILIIRLSAIGDVIMASPLIEAFQRTFPHASISWLVEEPAKAILEANENLHEIIVWERSKWRRLIREKRLLSLFCEVVGFIRHLRRQHFDLVVDAQGLLKSGVWAFLTGAPERIGIGSKEGSRYFMTRVVDRNRASDRVSSQYLLLAEELGLELDGFSMNVPVSPEAEKYASDFMESLSSSYVVLSPFTTRPQKHWIEERWRDLTLWITNEMGMAVVLLGGKGDEVAARRIIPEGRQALINLVGETSIQQAASIIKHASLLIGVDTGLTHMGFALHVPTIALFGATCPYLDTGGMPGSILYHALECSPCRRSPTCDGDFTCMKAISTKEVVEVAKPYLESR